jgi:hypothetical protein
MLRSHRTPGCLINFPLVGRAPAALAVMVQCLALLFSLVTLSSLDSVVPISWRVPSFVLIQAVFSALLSVLLRMAHWWRWIHFSFPLGIYGFLSLHLPSDVYLIGFCVTLALFWTTFSSQVPFYPSRFVVRQKVAEIVPKNKPIRLIDIGSGLGDLSMFLAKNRPESRVEGIEIAPLPWMISLARAFLSQSTAQFIRGNYHALNFADYDVVFAYLSPAAMPALWTKASQEMRAGSMLISYEFEIPDIKPSLVVPTSATTPPLYVWKM